MVDKKFDATPSVKKLSNKQKEALLRAFQAMKRAAEAGERFVHQVDQQGHRDSSEITTVELIQGQVRGIVDLALEVDNALRLYFGASVILEHITRVRNRIDRKGLKFVKGGK